jgi:hypothetical protein
VTIAKRRRFIQNVLYQGNCTTDDIDGKSSLESAALYLFLMKTRQVKEKIFFFEKKMRKKMKAKKFFGAVNVTLI